MTIHTTCCQVAGRAVTPQGVAADGDGATGAPGAGGVAAVGRAGGLTGGATGRAAPSSTRSSGAVAPDSRLATGTGCLPSAERASETAGTRVTRLVTSTVAQRLATSGPVGTARGPVRGALRNVSACSFHGRSEAWRTTSPAGAALSG